MSVPIYTGARGTGGLRDLLKPDYSGLKKKRRPKKRRVPPPQYRRGY